MNKRLRDGENEGEKRAEGRELRAEGGEKEEMTV